MGEMGWRIKLNMLLQLEEGLSKWELDFIEDMSRESDKPMFQPTPDQLFKIEQIYDEKV